ncbi:hypothetical protein AEGHOMDF_5151 [Methylobacterium soli]|nr:hypothetical protein AEGHOMDF_5151 [Methylobacterium soli]
MLAVTVAAIDRAEALGLGRLARGVPREAEMLEVMEHHRVAGRQAEAARRLGGVAAGGEAALAQSLGLEEAQLVEGDAGPAASDPLDEKASVIGHHRMVHVEAQRRDQRHTPLGLLGEVRRHRAAAQGEVLVDGGDDDPIRPPAALLPGLVLQGLVREDEGFRLHPGEPAQFDLRMRGEEVAGAVGRAIVVDDVAIDPGIVMPEEEAEHVGLVPADGVEVDDRLHHETASPL